MDDPKTCIVIGGSSQMASWLVPELLAQGWTVHLVSRTKRKVIDYGPSAVWHHFDANSDVAHDLLPTAPVVFSTIGNASGWLKSTRGINRIVSFSSTSILTKESSDDPADVEMIVRVTGKERRFIETCEQIGIKWTIVRPTLIYGGKFGDRTVDDIARMICRFSLFPILGHGDGLRQPVHARDLADACLRIYDNPTTFGRIYNIGGSEVLTFRSMVERIFLAMDRTPRVLQVPAPVFNVVAAIMRAHPRYRHIRSSMAKRMDKNMTFPNSDAVADFGYSPSKFDPKPVVQVPLMFPNAWPYP